MDKNKEKDLPVCSFCGKETHSGIKSEGENPHFICEECLVNGTNAMIDSMKKDGLSPYEIFINLQDIREGKEGFTFKLEEENNTKNGLLKPKEIKELLDQYVVGQDAAKRVLSVAAYNHYKRIGMFDKKHDVDIQKSNVLLLGPTGTGKTLLVKTLAKSVSVPFAIADATSLTENGYVGDDVESVIEKLYLAADKNVKRAEKGIIYIDEIDKIAADFESSRKDVGGAGVQQALLKIIEGHKIHFVPNSDKKNPMASSIEIDTSNILFIVGGAFANIDYNNVEHDSLRDYGIIPELLGRLPIITQTEELSKEDMIRILTEPKDSIIKQYQAMFDMDDVELFFTDEVIEAIANESLEAKTGARGLRGTIEKIMLDLTFEAPSVQNLSKVVIDYKNNKIRRKFITFKREASM